MFAGPQCIDLKIRTGAIIVTTDIIPDGNFVCLICFWIVNLKI